MDHWTEAFHRYEGYRDAARDATRFTMFDFAEMGRVTAEVRDLRLTAITDEALALAVGWSFPWRRIIGQLRPYLRRLEVAVWHGERLCGLGAGRPSRGPDNVTIHFLERPFDDNPYAGIIAHIVTDVADNYAKVIGRQRVKLRSPEPGAVPKYESLRFSLAEPIRGVTYYVRRVS